MSSNDSSLNVLCESFFTNMRTRYHYYMSQNHIIHYHINAYMNCILVIPTAFLNFSVIVVLWKTKALRALSNIPIIFLAGWDLLTAVLSQPIFAAYLLYITKLKFSCALMGAVKYVSAIVAMTSSFIVVVITTERYLALFHVFFWSGHITRKMLFIPLSLIWVIPFVLCIVMYEVKPIAGIAIYTFLILLAILWISVSYFKMFKLIRKMQLRVMPRDNGNQSENDIRSKQARLSRFTFAIVCLYLVMNIPYCVSVILLSTVFKDDYYTDAVKWYFATWLMCNSLLNPIVYAWQSPQIGRGLLRLWRMRKVYAGRSVTYDKNDASKYKTDPV
ncbi:adrenocorticotropic hormone receptor-like [Rhopilema esculentum]|uniref:adrenocorticotropic hormone receptor-like n=1 Tax=Rhopilema esculentum TaxID=499914 RepID=UPI0031E03ECA